MYAFLFLHLDSGTHARDFGNRTEMIDHALNLERLLDKAEGKTVNALAIVIAGDKT